MKQWVDQQVVRRVGIILSIIVVVLVAWWWLGNSSKSVAGAPATAPLAVTVGSDSGAPKMIVYTDVLCDRCKEYHSDTLKKVIKEYADTGKLQLEFRPIAIVSERSSNITELAMCANDQGAFLPAMEYLYDDLYADESISSEKQAATFFKRHSFSEIAKALSIDEKQLAECKTERRYDEQIAEADRKAGEAEIVSTPITFIKGSEPIRGYAQYSYIRSLIEMM